MGACRAVGGNKGGGGTQPDPGEAGSKLIIPIFISTFFSIYFSFDALFPPGGGFYLNKLFAWPGFGFI